MTSAMSPGVAILPSGTIAARASRQLGLAVDRLGHRGVHEARADGVGADAVGRPFHGHHLGQHDQRRLGRAVGAGRKLRHDAGHRRHHDDGALGLAECGCAALASSQLARRLMLNRRSQASTSRSTSFAGEVMPALPTMASMPPIALRPRRSPWPAPWALPCRPGASSPCSPKHAARRQGLPARRGRPRRTASAHGRRRRRAFAPWRGRCLGWRR